jgi:hypothetical protein
MPFFLLPVQRTGIFPSIYTTIQLNRLNQASWFLVWFAHYSYPDTHESYTDPYTMAHECQGDGPIEIICWPVCDTMQLSIAI